MKTKTTLEFIADLKKKTGLDSDYAIANLLGITKNALSLYRNGKSFFGDEVAMRVAQLLEIDPGYVVACIHAERAKPTEEKKLWQRIADILSTKEAAGIVAGLLLFAVLPYAQAPNADGFNVAFFGMVAPASFGRTLYIMSNCIAAYWWLFLPLFILSIKYLPVRLPPKLKKSD